MLFRDRFSYRVQMTNRGFRIGLSPLPELEGNYFTVVSKQTMVNSTAVEGQQWLAAHRSRAWDLKSINQDGDEEARL